MYSQFLTDLTSTGSKAKKFPKFRPVSILNYFSFNPDPPRQRLCGSGSWIDWGHDNFKNMKVIKNGALSSSILYRLFSISWDCPLIFWLLHLLAIGESCVVAIKSLRSVVNYYSTFTYIVPYYRWMCYLDTLFSLHLQIYAGGAAEF